MIKEYSRLLQPGRAIAYPIPDPHTLEKTGGPHVELQDILRVAGVGLVIAFLHLFFEQTGKKEYSFFIFFIAYLYITAEMLRFLRIFFTEISSFFSWLSA